MKSISPDSRSTGSNSCRFMLTGQNRILSVRPSGIPPRQDTSRYSRHLTPNEKTTRLSGLYLYQDCLIIPPISSLFLCTLYINSQVTLDIKLNLITQMNFTSQPNPNGPYCSVRILVPHTRNNNMTAPILS